MGSSHTSRPSGSSCSRSIARDARSHAASPAHAQSAAAEPNGGIGRIGRRRLIRAGGKLCSIVANPLRLARGDADGARAAPLRVSGKLGPGQGEREEGDRDAAPEAGGPERSHRPADRSAGGEVKALLAKLREQWAKARESKRQQIEARMAELKAAYEARKAKLEEARRLAKASVESTAEALKP